MALRFADLKPFHVMDVLERAKALEAQGAAIIHLEIGEPDFDQPPCVAEAARKAIADGQTHYTHSQGLLELREAICQDVLERYGAAVHPEQVLVASGTSPAMLLAFAVLLGPGRTACITDPGYACYESFIRHAGGEARRVPVREEDGFQYDLRALHEALTPDVAAVVVNSPANPTGTLIPDTTLAALADLDVPLVSDEIYHGLVYEGRERSVLEFTDQAYVLNGFSKRYAMTGWRLGYLIAPRAAVPTLRGLAQNLFICAGSVAQWAGLAALRHGEADVQRMRQIYDARRQALVAGLSHLGFGVGSRPVGAFYVFANAGFLGPRARDSLALAMDILERAHVGVAPGVDFGPGGEGYLRFSYANSLENIEEGLHRLERYIAGV